MVIEQDYSSGNASNDAFLVRDELGTIQSVRISDIRAVRKVANDKEDIVFDVKMNPGELMINRQSADLQTVTETNDRFVFDSLSHQIIVPLNGNPAVSVTVEYLEAGSGSNVERFQLVQIQRDTVKKQNIHYFDYRSLVNNVVRPSSLETSVNGTVKAEYTVSGPAAYALYDPQSGDAFMFIVR